MINNLFIFSVALFLVIKGATLATKYASQLAASYRLSKYTVGFIIIALISILPETIISVNSALQGIPSFGLGMLFGSNIADLTLISALIVFIGGRNLRVESKIIKTHVVYPFILLLPLVLGLNGHFSRLEGAALVIAGAAFYYLALLNSTEENSTKLHNEHGKIKSILMLLFSMLILLAGSHYTVSAATALAQNLGVSPILIGMLVVGIGTTMPEFFFSLKSVRAHDDSLALGDILGTVLADATIVVGILALVSPFAFPQKIIYITGVFMFLAAFILYYFMKTGRRVTKKEGILLFLFWVVFVLVEFISNRA